MATFNAVSSYGYTPDDLIPIGDASRLLGVSINTVRRWEAQGKITAIRTLGQQRRFRRGDIEELLARGAA